MKNSTRRNFLSKSSLLTVGAAAGADLALGETEVEHSLKGVDRELASVVRSYGRADVMKAAGYQDVAEGNKTRRLPASQLGVRVRDQASYQASFAKLATISERVMVEGNTVRFARGQRYFILENRVV